MAGAKGIVLALAAFGEAAQAAILAQGGKLLAPAGNNLVDIRLVTHIKHYFILRCGKNAVQSQC